MTKKKKIIILSCMIALLAVTAVFNFVFATGSIDSTDQQANASASEASFFTQYRSERQTTRNQDILQLDSVLEMAEVGSQEYLDALALKNSITKNTENEMLVENIIKSYGYEDVVVIIGLDSENVNVIAKCDELTKQDYVQIYTVVAEELAVSPENVSIKYFS